MPAKTPSKENRNVEPTPPATGSARIATTDGAKDVGGGESATTHGSVDHASFEKSFRKDTVEGGSGSGHTSRSGPAEAVHKGNKI